MSSARPRYNSSSLGSNAASVAVATGLGASDVLGRAMVIHDSTGARIACGTISLDAMTPTTTQLIDAAWWAVGPVGPVGPVGYGWIWGVPTHGWFISWKIRKHENCGYNGYITNINQPKWYSLLLDYG